MQIDNQTERDELADLYSDFYKSVYNVRPRHINFSTITVEELNEEIESLRKIADDVAAENQAREEQAIKEFEEQVATTINLGAKDRRTALRWIMDASEANDDWQYFCYLHQLPYNYFDKKAN